MVTWLVLAAGVAAATAVMLAAPALGPPTVPFGVRVPRGRIADPAVTAAALRYRRATLLLGAALLALVTAGTLSGAAAAAVLAAVAAAVGGHLVLRVRAHRSISAAKQAGDWYSGLRQTAAADTTLRTDPVPMPWRWLAPSAVLAGATAAAGAAAYPRLPGELMVSVRYSGGQQLIETAPTTPLVALSPVIGQIACFAVLTGVLAAVLRARPQIDADRPSEAAAQYRRFLTVAGRCIAAAVFGSVLCLAGLAALMWTGTLDRPLPAVLALVPGLIAAVAAFGALAAVGQGGWRLRQAAPAAETGSGNAVQRDDDRSWRLGGLVYADRSDPALLVPKRSMGLGWTVNLGHPVAICLAAAAVLASAAAAAALFTLDLPPGGAFYGWHWSP